MELPVTADAGVVSLLRRGGSSPVSGAGSGARAEVAAEGEVEPDAVGEL